MALGGDTHVLTPPQDEDDSDGGEWQTAGPTRRRGLFVQGKPPTVSMMDFYADLFGNDDEAVVATSSAGVTVFEFNQPKGASVRYETMPDPKNPHYRAISGITKLDASNGTIHYKAVYKTAVEWARAEHDGQFVLSGNLVITPAAMEILRDIVDAMAARHTDIVSDVLGERAVGRALSSKLAAPGVAFTALRLYLAERGPTLKAALAEFTETYRTPYDLKLDTCFDGINHMARGIAEVERMANKASRQHEDAEYIKAEYFLAKFPEGVAARTRNAMGVTKDLRPDYEDKPLVEWASTLKALVTDADDRWLNSNDPDLVATRFEMVGVPPAVEAYIKKLIAQARGQRVDFAPAAAVRSGGCSRHPHARHTNEGCREQRAERERALDKGAAARPRFEPKPYRAAAASPAPAAAGPAAPGATKPTPPASSPQAASEGWTRPMPCIHCKATHTGRCKEDCVYGEACGRTNTDARKIVRGDTSTYICRGQHPWRAKK